MKWLIKLTGKYLWVVVLLCIFTVLLTLAGVVQALAMRNFLDLAAAGDQEGFLRWFFIFFCLIFFQLVGGAAKNLFYHAASTAMYDKFRMRCFHTILTREYASLHGYNIGEYMQLISADTNVVVSTFFSLPAEICVLVTKVIGASVCLTTLQGNLALLLLGCFAIMLFVGLPLRRFVRKYHKLVMESQGKVLGTLQEVLGNLSIIRSFQAIHGVEAQTKERMDTSRKIIMKKTVLSQVLNSGCSAAVNVAYIIGMLWCGMGIVRGTVSFGMFSAVWQLIGQITSPAMQVTGIMPQYYTMMASVERLQELEKLPQEMEIPTLDWKKMRKNFLQIQCKKLSFSYDNAHSGKGIILRDLDFVINRGDFIAFTGESGAGKSTFLKLMLGLYSPQESAICVRNSDGEIYFLDAGIREMVSYVPQGNFLMSGTIRDAVHFWQGESVDEEKLKEACRIAEAEGFISNLDMGYDTLLSERGAGLSEGQLQRLAIARALYSEKPVLLLDEATSALDEQTEAKVLKNLRRLENRTVIIVTHRKAALDICNRIVEIDGGRLYERNEF